MTKSEGSIATETKGENGIAVQFVDARPPFPIIAHLRLDALPQKGDLVVLQTSSGLQSYRVKFSNLNPYQMPQISIGALPHAVQTTASTQNQLDEIAKRDVQIYEKGQAYTNALIVAGYVGAFTIFSLNKPSLSTMASGLISTMLGLSLLFFITWEIYSMINRALQYARFAKRVEAGPESFFATWQDSQKKERSISMRYSRLWHLTLLPTIVLGYSAILLLLYNAAAGFLPLPHLP